MLSDLDLSIFEATRGMRLIFLPDAPRYTILAASTDMCRHLGMAKEQLTGRGVFEAFPASPDDPDFAGGQKLRASLDYVVHQQLEHRITHQRYDIPTADGHFKESYWNNYSTPVLNEAGGVACIVHTAEDITGAVKAGTEKAAREELQIAYDKMQESEQKYRRLFESMDQGFCVFRMIFDAAGTPVDYRFLETNAVFEEHTGLKDAAGKTARELVPDLEPYWFEQYGRVALTGEAARFVQGSEAMGRWFDVYAYRTGHPEAHQVALLFTDVTERRKTEERIRQSEANLRNIILKSPVAMCLFKGADHVLEIANDRMFGLWGKNGAALLGKPIFTGLPEVKGQGFEQLLDSVFHTGETVKAFGVPVMLPRSGGVETLYINFVYEAYREQDGSISGVMAVATDVTEQVLSGKKIEEAEERARLAIEGAELGTIEVNLQTDEVIVSQRMNEIFGVVPGSDREAYISAIHPDDRAVRRQAYEKAFRDGLLEYEARVLRQEGTDRWIRVKGSVFFDGAGKPLRLVSVIQDITEEKSFAAELTRQVAERTAALQAAVRELERSNEELQQFAHVASHDLKEPVRKMLTFADMLRHSDGGGLSATGRMSLQKIYTGANRMMNMVNGVLAYSKLEAAQQAFEPVDLNHTIASVESDLEVLIGETDARIVKTGLGQVYGAPVLLHQLFYNLLNNALKFRKPETHPEISITATARPDGMVRIVVADNGIGFEPEYAERIFTTFTRLHAKDRFEGTGLGLSLCRKIAERHGGTIHAEGMLGGGASFMILLPAGNNSTS